MSKLASILSEKSIVFFQADKISLDPYFYEPFQDTDERFATSVILKLILRIRPEKSMITVIHSLSFS